MSEGLHQNVGWAKVSGWAEPARPTGQNKSVHQRMLLSLSYFFFLSAQHFTDTIEPPIETGPFYRAPKYRWPIIGPSLVRTAQSLSVFSKTLKTHLFRLHLDPTEHDSPPKPKQKWTVGGQTGGQTRGQMLLHVELWYYFPHKRPKTVTVAVVSFCSIAFWDISVLFVEWRTCVLIRL